MSTIMTETHQIQPQLTALNARGFLTINSQPRVNGAPSDDSHVGWGGPHGYSLCPSDGTLADSFPPHTKRAMTHAASAHLTLQDKRESRPCIRRASCPTLLVS